MAFPRGIAEQVENTVQDAECGDPYACMQCGRHLSADEIGLHKKLINRGARRFMCIDCMAAHYQTTVAAMQERIAHFRATGCSLFQ